MTEPTFLVDRDGLAKLLERRGKEFAVVELIQNAWDEAPSSVSVELIPEPGEPYCILKVEDDSPEGFHDLAHAYTLFAESRKKVDPDKRGRFNLGEKLVIALCTDAKIETTKGTVMFDRTGRTMSRRKRAAGTLFQGRVRMTRDEYRRTCEVIKTLIPPPDILTMFNMEELERRSPVGTFRETLPTEIADAEGYLRPTSRVTTIELYEPERGEIAHLYELGIPVVETGDAFHVNVLQKVPLNADRDNVTPSYLRTLRTHVLNQTFSLMNHEELKAPWVGEALADERVDDAAVQAVITKRYGHRRVIADPSDPEGTKLAVSKGYTVIQPGSFTREQWANIRRSAAALPAGQVTPSPKPFHPDGEALKLLPEEKWTPGIDRIVRYAKDLALAVLDIPLAVIVANDPGWGYRAAYGSGELTLNVAKLSYRWFDGPLEQVNHLLIHEFAHQYASDHLSQEYHRALCRVAARTVKVALENPALFESYQEVDA